MFPKALTSRVIFLLFSLQMLVGIVGQEYLVRKYLLATESRPYDRFERPGVNKSGPSSGPVQVKLAVALNQIGDVDEKSEVVTTNLWIRIYWKDPRLVWLPKDFKYVHEIRVDRDEIWKPDITIYNDVRTEARELSDYPVAIKSTGDVSMLYPMQLISTCLMDISKFPFDQQVCLIKFGSWTYTGRDIMITNKSATGDIKNFVQSSEWTLDKFMVRSHVVKYSCCPDPYPDVTFYIVITRKALHYLTSIVIPVMLIVLVTLFSFYMPPACGERIGLNITNLLAMTVYMLIVADLLPPQSKVFPLIYKFFVACLILMGLIMLFNIINLAIYFKGETDTGPPDCVANLFIKYFAPIVWLQVDSKYARKIKRENRNQSSVDREQPPLSTSPFPPSNYPENAAVIDPPVDVKPKEVNRCGCCLCKLHGENAQGCCKCVFCSSHNSKEKKKVPVEEECIPGPIEWRIVAIVLDRIVMVVLFFVFLILVVSIMLDVSTDLNDPTKKKGY